MQNREKQIEETALGEAIRHAEETAKTRDDLCDECRKEHQQLADWLKELKEYRTKGYRKASEVAREIFAEIFNLMNDVYSSVQYGCYSYGMTKHTDSPSAQRQCGKLEGVKYLGDRIAELKKKYAEGEG
jgi:isopenicillin N synthase-like dioxygenase